jgi:hypothetical protein
MPGHHVTWKNNFHHTKLYTIEVLTRIPSLEIYYVSSGANTMSPGLVGNITVLLGR